MSFSRWKCLWWHCVAKASVIIRTISNCIPNKDNFFHRIIKLAHFIFQSNSYSVFQLFTQKYETHCSNRGLPGIKGSNNIIWTTGNRMAASNTTNHNRITILRILRRIAHNAVCEGFLASPKWVHSSAKYAEMDANLKEAKEQREHNSRTNFQLRSRRTFDRGANWPGVRATVLGWEAEPHNKKFCKGNAGSTAVGDAVKLFRMFDGLLCRCCEFRRLLWWGAVDSILLFSLGLRRCL